MNITLIRKLVAAGVIRENTEIDANYAGIDLSGNPLAKARGTFFLKTLKVIPASETVIFETVSTIDGRPRTISDKDVVMIDGMDVNALGAIYGIDTKGGAIPQGKRRGRKPGAKKAARA